LTELAGTGTPLGEIFDVRHVEERRTVLSDSGAAIVFYTDGLVEYGRDILAATSRLETVVRERAFLRSEEPANALIEAVLGGHPTDDVAVLVMRVGERRRAVMHPEPPEKK
jgi:serine phosphatase RsbU (regulator of sigma subunit)